MFPLELSIIFPSYSQVIVKLGNQETEGFPFESPVTPKDLELLRWYIEVYATQYTSEPDDEEARRIEAKLITLGNALFLAIFSTFETQALFQQFQQQQTNKFLTIHTNEAHILALPWELLCEPEHDFLSQQQPPISIRRLCIQNQKRIFTIQAKSKLRFLFIVSRPTDASFLNPRSDPQAVMNALEEQGISQIEVEFLRPATLAKLTERLNNQELPPIDIIHFDGHGAYNEKSQRGYLLFEASPEDAFPSTQVSAALLGRILTSHNVSLVVLSACQSATVGNEPLGSVAVGLTDNGIPTVIAMVYSVLVQTTRELFTHFYQQIANGQGIGAALDNARKEMVQQNKRSKKRHYKGEFELVLQDWFVPALYQANNDSALLLKDLQCFENLTRRAVNDLPKLQTAGFFGRSQELWQIERWFVQDVERITITGFGGQGKTYCAIEAAQWLLRTDLFDAVCFVDFSRYQGLDALRYAMNALGVLLDTTLLDENAVPALLQTRRLLWVWDNLESLAAETLEELLTVAVQWSAQCRFLFTTRQHRFTQNDYVEKTNSKHQYLDLGGLAETDALAYFNQLWQTAPLPEQPYPARYELMALFSKVAFHPLSIGLLAQQLKTRTIAKLGERLEALLLCEPEGSEDKSLLASLKLSLERLSPEQRELVKRLGVFQGGAMEHMILAITKINESAWTVLRSALENIGLIQAEDLISLGVAVPYIKFNSMLHIVLWQQLDNMQQKELLGRYMQGYYEFSNYLYFEDNKNANAARTIAVRDLSNLIYAVNTAFQLRETFVSRFISYVIKFIEYFELRHERANLIEIARQISAEVGSESWYLSQVSQGRQFFHERKYKQAEAIFQAIVSHHSTTPCFELSFALEFLGSCLLGQKKTEAAIASFCQGLDVAKKLESSDQVQNQIAGLYSGLANALRDSNNYTGAKQYYLRALGISKEVGDKRSEAAVQVQLGTFAMLQSNLVEAEQHYQIALGVFQTLHELQEEGNIWYQLGMLYRKGKALQLAEQAHRESARIRESLGDLKNAANSWNELANLAKKQSKIELAESYYHKAIAIQKLADPSELIMSLHNLANLLLETQPPRLNEAQQLAEEALAICKTIDKASGEIWKAYEFLAQIAEKQKNSEKTKEYRRLSRDSYLSFEGMPHQMRQYAWSIGKVIMAIFKQHIDEDLATDLEQMKQNGDDNLVAVIPQLIHYEHNEEELIESLNYQEAAIVHLILKGLKTPKILYQGINTESLNDLFNS